MWAPQQEEKSMEQSIAGLPQTELYSAKIELFKEEKCSQVFCSERVTEKIGQSFK